MERNSVFFLWLLTFSGCFFVDAQDINSLIDQVLDLVHTKIVEEDLNELPIDDVNYDFSYKLWLLTVYGNFQCSGGKVRSLATVYRTGDADAEIFNGTLDVHAPLGLKVLNFNFDKCSLQLKDILSYSSGVSGNVGSSSIDFKVTIRPDMKYCTAIIDQAQLLNLSDIKITTGPLSALTFDFFESVTLITIRDHIPDDIAFIFFKFGSDFLAHLRDEIINGIIWRLRSLIFSSVRDAVKVYEKREFHFTEDSFPIGNSAH